MSINHAILGILSYQSLTGYDLKKIIQDSPFMPWSGNNNQIYKSLVELLGEGYLTSETHQQESSPPKKIYTITEKGLAQLKEWVMSYSEPPEFKKMFLVQLAWAEQLNSNELNTLLSSYENEISMQLLMHEEKKRREAFSPNRSSRETIIWERIHENVMDFYTNEWNWIQKLRKELSLEHVEGGSMKMKYNLIEKGDKTYLVSHSAETMIRTEQDALDLIGACMEHQVALLMIHEEALSEDFFKLRNGLAGQIVQKLVNYRIKTAVIISNAQLVKGKAKEMLAEYNKGNEFRVFASEDEAEKWLLG